MSQYSYKSLDRVLDSRIRLAVAALLASVDWADFRFIRQQTGTTDGNLGAHLKTLSSRGYIEERKRFLDGKPNTSYRLTAEGRRALENHLAQLQQMLNPPTPPEGT